MRDVVVQRQRFTITRKREGGKKRRRSETLAQRTTYHDLHRGRTTIAEPPGHDSWLATIPKMNADMQDLVRICERLPEREQAVLVDFARFLVAKLEDEAWERAIADPRARPKLDDFVRAALAERIEPTDNL